MSYHHRAQQFFDLIPHAKYLDMQVQHAVRNHVVASIPLPEASIGHPDERLVHGGIISTLVDTVSGSAVLCAIPEDEGSLATLDLRLDYMRPAIPGQPLFAAAECYRLTRQIAFVRCIAYHSDKDKPIVQSMSSFMRQASSHPSILERPEGEQHA